MDTTPLHDSSAASPADSNPSQAWQSHQPGPVSDPSARGSGAPSRSKPNPKSKQVCRFFTGAKGCRAGDRCPYLHPQPQPKETAVPKESGTSPSSSTPVPPQNSRDATTGIDALTSREPSSPRPRPSTRNDDAEKRVPASRPTSSLEEADPREFQIRQVVRRFAPFRADLDNTTTLKFRLTPSDPDFPFDLDDGLQCTLSVPKEYPRDGKPALRVTNAEMPRGFQINVEKGFDGLATTARTTNRTLLACLNDLDKKLETFLTQEKAPTVTFVTNIGKKETKNEAPKQVGAVEDLGSTSHLDSRSRSCPVQSSRSIREVQEARGTRTAQVSQLESRMGRLPAFSKSADATVFYLPIQVPQPARLPTALCRVQAIRLTVPELYPLEPCVVGLKGVEGAEVNNVESAFEQEARAHPERTLMAHVNNLIQHMHEMVFPPAASPVVSQGHVWGTTDTDLEPVARNPSEAEARPEVGLAATRVDEERPHLRYVAQPPPEWRRPRRASDESESDDEDGEETSGFEGDTTSDTDSDGQTAGAALPSGSGGAATEPEKGVLLSFPNLELTGIELLQVSNLAIAARCDRCKDTLDVRNIKPSTTTATTGSEPDNAVGVNVLRTETCHKCASPCSLRYRSEPMHAHSVRAGYLDLEGCTVVDLLLSNFVPTCSECSTTVPSPGVSSVRGQTSVARCRECHRQMTFTIPEVKFLRVAFNGPSHRRAGLPLRRKRDEKLGLVAGTELPDRGKCRHYTKSYRWFRFSCCDRVYPCDRCHDEKEEHPNEHANRMVCGWCSREQIYRPEDCKVCRRSVVRKTGGGFWEGGKGTRDKTRMSRKDPRKYKRTGA